MSIANEIPNLIELNAKQLEVYHLAQKMAQKLVTDAQYREEHEIFAEDLLKEMGTLGLLGINIPEIDGGREAGVVAYIYAVRTLARACASTTVAMMVTNMVAETIAKFGTDAQKQQFLHPLKSGTWPALGFCLSEPSSGSDAAAMKSTAVKSDDHYLLNGVKTWITSGGKAGAYLLTAKLNSQKVTTFILPADHSQLYATKKEDKLGLRSSHTTQIIMDQCVAPLSSLLGEENQGLKVMFNALDGGRIGVSAQAIGVADAAIDLLIKRSQQNPANKAEIQQWLGQAIAKRDASWMLCLDGAIRKDQSLNLTQNAAMSKVFCTEKANEICRWAVQAWQNEDCLENRLAQRLARDARVMRIYEGTSEIQRLVIAREAIKNQEGLR